MRAVVCSSFGPPENLDLRDVPRSLVGVFWGAFRQKEPKVEAANFRQLFEWHANGQLHPRISEVLPLEQAPAALRSLLDRTAIGKIVLTTKQGAT